MPSTRTDRLDGLSTSVAVKAPVKIVATSNITLYGEQTVNGVAVTEGDRVLCIAQDSSIDNGIYEVSTSAWGRAPDFDGPRDVRKGTLVVSNGDSSIYYRVVSDDAIVIGSNAVLFEPVAGAVTQSSIGLALYPRTQAEINAGVTPSNHAYPPGDTRRYPNGIYDAIAQAKQTGGERLIQWHGSPVITSEIVVDGEGIVLDCHDVHLSTSANITMLRFGAAAGSTSAYAHQGLRGSLTITGAGAGMSNNHGLVIRNHSYGDFGGTVKFTNIGGTAIAVLANARGVQYNRIGAGWQSTGNFGATLDIDAGATVGGYVNDNAFFNIRGHAQAAGITHGRMRGQQVVGNRFYGLALESQSALCTLLDMDSAESNCFFGLRLDGVPGTTTINIASGVVGNLFFGFNPDGSFVDASNRNLFFGDQGTLSFPYLRFGSADTASATGAFEVAMQQPGGSPELHIASKHSGGLVRVPSGTVFGVGDRETGGDTPPIAFTASSKRLDFSTLGDTAIGSGPTIRFDGRFSSSGNEGTVTLQQDAHGLAITPSTAGGMVHVAGGVLSLTDGITAPAAVSGRVQIYVDTADGDLKAIFGDGTVKVISADT
jgi:hypothetical protein